ncbi:hypothetical protein Ct61P_15126 [Colletotrichum tofieldiae]|nr:hypothetical protein Ct61P_15126 [Colletotrichum tofieldiae]
MLPKRNAASEAYDDHKVKKLAGGCLVGASTRPTMLHWAHGNGKTRWQPDPAQPSQARQDSSVSDVCVGRGMFPGQTGRQTHAVIGVAVLGEDGMEQRGTP